MHSQTFVFAYGSNLDPERMGRRIPSSVSIGRSRLVGHDLRFHVRGIRGRSAKADAFPTDHDTDEVLGVIYRMDAAELPKLDEIEGGYRRVLHRLRLEPTSVSGEGSGLRTEPRTSQGLQTKPKASPGPGTELQTGSGPQTLDAWAYHSLPDTVQAGLLPYDWYLGHVIRGARAHAFPETYLEQLQRIEAVSQLGDDR